MQNSTDRKGNVNAHVDPRVKQSSFSLLVNKILMMSPTTKISVVMLVDAAICFSSVLIAYALTGTPLRSFFVEDAALAAMAAVVVVIFLRLVNAYSAVIRFIDPALTLRLFQGYFAASAIFYLLAQLLHMPSQGRAIGVFLLLGPLLSMQVRLVAQKLLRPAGRDARLAPVVIYGAGHAGTQLAAALAISARYRVKAFVDDRISMHGREVHGLKVYSPSALYDLKEKGHCEQVFLAIPSVTKSRRRHLLESLEELSVKVQVVPGLDELASGQRRPDEIREVQVEDLLGRDPVAPIQALAEAHVRDQCVLVTGAGGSIGSELCRQVATLGLKKLVLFEVSEFALYKIEQELRPIAEQGHFELVPVMGSVADKNAIERAIRKHGVDTVYHAAAYKHVPLVEDNILSALKNNIFGTLYTCNAAINNGVRNFILISTDKAVRPTSVMGASKRVCELIVQTFAMEQQAMSMSMVRFGNVLASSGSVVPLFREQILRGGPVTVTHPEVTRYFMTIPEAAQLVLQAGAMGKKGEVFVLDMGRPVKIYDLAERMIRLSGLEVRNEEHPRGDIEVLVTGLRPGEKLYEELLIGNNPSSTQHPRIFLAREAAITKADLVALMARLEKAINDDSVDSARQCLCEVVEGFDKKERVDQQEKPQPRNIGFKPASSNRITDLPQTKR